MTALSADRLRVELADGAVQDIAIAGLQEDGSDVRVELTETSNGEVVRTEGTRSKRQEP